ncbi:hypothetical protein Leryth_001985 [Lithospermum erythrorhizon]|nr:hypothetical protein Leryth_001985 [Lithospermum erythrorhizon]
MKKPSKDLMFPLFFPFFLTLLLFPAPILSWKKDEFRNCNQTPFCKRSRSRNPGSCNLVSTDVLISEDGDLVAKLIPKSKRLDFYDENDNNIENGTNIVKPLVLTVSVYQNGIFRLKIDEDKNLGLPKKRFEVPDVVVDEFERTKLYLSRKREEKIGDDLVESSIFYLADGYEGVIRHDPFEVFVREKGSKERVLSLNSNGLFDFEQLKGGKEEGEDWEERFRSHVDSRPYGPQSISFDVTFYGADFVYGIPEHATSLALKPTRGPGIEHSEPYRLFNLDVFEYLHESPFGLYGSIPFMISHGKGRGTSGFFWLNAAEMQIDVLGSGWDAGADKIMMVDQKRIDTLWMAEAGVVDTFFFVGPKPKDVVRQYTSVTGTPAMPQLFATAYHQCRWNYRDEEDVYHVDSKFDEHDIPYDVLWLDIEHTDGKKYFTWDKVLFPNPEEMQNKLASKGRRMVTIVDPHIKRDDSYHIHKEASQDGYYVKDASGKDFDGWCWPGSSSYIDMLSPEIRSWWGDKFSYDSYQGSTPSLYIWNDMNEPSVFNGPEVTMPRDALHYGGVEHRELHNAYGYYFHMATSEGLVKRGNGKDRPFVLSRAFFPGSQRYGAIWTGDNSANWDQLRVSIPMVLTLGLSGISFSGKESERNTELMSDAIHTRYTLLPYFYTLFREANTSGVPVVRPLWMEFPSDEKTFGIDEAFMVGNGLLVQGIYTERATDVSVYLPGEQLWYDLRSGMHYNGGQTHKFEASEENIPSFQRAGTIIPRKDRYRRSSMQMEHDPYTLVIALNSSQAAEGEVYIDDGKSFEFKKGAYIHRRFTFANGKLTSSDIAHSDGKTKYISHCTLERVILLGLSSAYKTALIEPGSKKAIIELGPLRLRGGRGPFVPTIRKPAVHMADDWSIQIS